MKVLQTTVYVTVIVAGLMFINSQVSCYDLAGVIKACTLVK